MGGGISTCTANKPIICPENYDEKSFEKIVTIYKRLDVNGNMIVEDNELNKMSNLNIKRKKKNLLIKKKIATNCYEKKKLELDLELKKSQEILIEEHKKMLKLMENVIEKDLLNLSNKISELDNLTLNEKRNLFIKKISTKHDEIDFWKFFSYMKNKVNDMDNIVWTPNDKTRRKSSLLVKIKSPNTRPPEYVKKFEYYYPD